MTHDDLVEIGYRWLKRRTTICFRDGFSTSGGGGEIPDLLGWYGPATILIECKASRRDFMADAKKSFRKIPELGMGCFRYYLCVPDVIRCEDLPDRWGLLWAKHGKVYVQRRNHDTPFSDRNVAKETEFLVSMLRRAQVRLGDVELDQWLRIQNVRPN